MTSGFRLVLTYNLVQAGDGVPDSAEEMEEGSTRLRHTLQAWTRRGTSEKVIYMLDHQHTETSLRQKNLKGADTLRVKHITKATDETNMAVLLVDVSREVCGGCDDEDEYDDDGKYHTLFDEDVAELTLSRVVDLDRHVLGNGTTVDAEVDFVQDLNDFFEHRAPDDADFEGWTGNEGAQATPWYRYSVSQNAGH